MLCACPASVPLFRDHLHPHPPRWGFLAQPLCVSFVLTLHHPSPDFTDVLLLFFVFGLFFPKPSFLCPSTRAEAFPASWASLSAPRGAGPASARTAVREPLYDIWTFILRQAGLLCGCQLSPRSELVATVSWRLQLRQRSDEAEAERCGRRGAGVGVAGKGRTPSRAGAGPSSSPRESAAWPCSPPAWGRSFCRLQTPPFSFYLLCSLRPAYRRSLPLWQSVGGFCINGRKTFISRYVL